MTTLREWVELISRLDVWRLSVSNNKRQRRNEFGKVVRKDGKPRKQYKKDRKKRVLFTEDLSLASKLNDFALYVKQVERTRELAEGNKREVENSMLFYRFEYNNRMYMFCDDKCLGEFKSKLSSNEFKPNSDERKELLRIAKANNRKRYACASCNKHLEINSEIEGIEDKYLSEGDIV